MSVRPFVSGRQSVSMNYEPGTCLIDEANSSSDIYGSGDVVSG